MQVRIPRLVPIGGVVQRQAHLSVKQETRVRPPSSPPITINIGKLGKVAERFKAPGC